MTNVSYKIVKEAFELGRSHFFVTEKLLRMGMNTKPRQRSMLIFHSFLT